MRSRSLLASVVLSFVISSPSVAQPKGLEVYFIDVEGGAATLLITPAGESILIDCGNPGRRDADRIHKTASQIGLKAIDHLFITHWHADHYGGIGRLAQLIPIKNFYDHGIPEKLTEDPKRFPFLIQAYKLAAKGKSRTLKPGDSIDLKQSEGRPRLRFRCLASDGKVIPDQPGAPANPIAKDHKPKPKDKSDNAMSLAFLIEYGPFRFLDLGDLTWNIEYKLVHPTDKIGPVDVYQVTHHGLSSSSNPVLVRTVRPRVAIFNNGARKGAHTSVMTTLRRVPDVKAIYQLHKNLAVGDQENTDPQYIANLKQKCDAEPIKLTVAPDGKSYKVKVGSKGKEYQYVTRNAK